MTRRALTLSAMALVSILGQALVCVAEEPKTGQKRDTLLYVHTDPRGAKVLFNGKELGTADGLFPVEPGTGTIFVELEGCKPSERQVIIRANGITRLELSLEPQAKAQPEAAGAHFIGHFPQGTIELLGITDYPPTDQSQWWLPDGSPAQLGPFRPEPTQWSLSPDKKPLAFLLRSENLPADASWPAWHIAPSTGNWGAIGVLDVDGHVVLDYHLFCPELGTSAGTANFRVGVSIGTWETVITQKADSLGTSSFSRDGQQWTVTFLKLEKAGRLADDSTRVTLTATDSYGKWFKRLQAITSDGTKHVSLIGFKGGDGTAFFDGVPLSSITEFRFQVRPYSWVEFKNVSLQPGQKTNVLILSSSSDTSTSPASKQAAVEPVSIAVGVHFFRHGDSITIREVQATSPDLKKGDRVIVKGYYSLASEPKASLCLFATATEGSGRSPIRPGQRISITKGEAEFELSETLEYDGYLHVTFYSVPTGKPFGGLYFGTAKQMEEIQHWDVQGWYTAEPRPASPSSTPTTTTEKSAAEDAIIEGVGWNGVRLGMSREEIVQVLGESESQPSPHRLRWPSKHIECTFEPDSNELSILRFEKGFKGALANGLRISSSENKMRVLYGQPDHLDYEPNELKRYAYGPKGIAFWTQHGKISHIFVFELRPGDVPPLAQIFAPTPHVVALDPPNGAKDVDPAFGDLRVTFNVPMADGFSWTANDLSKYPKTLGMAHWTGDHKTCVLPVELKPDCEYRLGLNGPPFQGFLSEAGVPLEPVEYTFTTGGARTAAENKAETQVSEATAKTVRTAQKAAEAWLALLDAGKYAETWDGSASFYKVTVTKAECERVLKALRSSFGAVKSRKVKSATFTRTAPGAPDGEYVVIEFDTQFENKAAAIETVTPMREKDGSWKVSGYYVK